MNQYQPMEGPALSYVEAVRSQVVAAPIRFTKSAEGADPITFDVWQERGGRVVNYRSYKGYAPFFYALKPVFVGPVVAEADVFSGRANPDSTTGVWNTSSNLHYTAETGATATFLASAPGTKLRLKTYTALTGGPAKAEVYDSGDNLVATKNFTCYGSPEALQYVFIAEGLPEAQYKVVLTNLGTGGQRLFVHYGFLQDGVRVPEALFSYVVQEMPPYIAGGDPVGPVNGIWNIGCFSNKEGAFSVHEGTNPAYFIPTHTAVTEKSGGAIGIWTDGTRRSLSSMYMNQTYTASERIDTLQHFYGVQPADPDKELMELWITTSYLPDGAVEFRGRFRILADVTMPNGYPLMLPCARRDGQFLYTSRGGRYGAAAMAGGSGTIEYFSHGEAGKAWSYLYAASQAGQIVSAMDVVDPSNSLRPLASDRGSAYLQHRNLAQSYVQKSYDEVFLNAVLPAGYEFSWAGRYIVAEVPDVPGILRSTIMGPSYPPAGTSAMPEPPSDGMAGSVPASLSFAHGGETKALAVTADGPWHLSVEGDGFSTATVDGYGNANIDIAASANGGPARTGQARLVCGTTLSVCSLSQE